MTPHRKTRGSRARTGGVYIVVLGTSLIVAMLGLSALVLGRIQSRTVTAAVDIRQAQLNAEAAIELGLLIMKDDPDWRENYNNNAWFSDRDLDPADLSRWSGCSLEVDNADRPPGEEFDELSDDPDAPVRLVGIGRAGPRGRPELHAEQRIELVVDPRHRPSDDPMLQILRAAAESTPRGIVENQAAFPWNEFLEPYVEDADAEEPPAALDVFELPTRTPNFGRNPSFNSGTLHWSNQPPDLPSASHSTVSFGGQSDCLRVTRSSRRAGAGNLVNPLLMKPNTQYRVEVEVHADLNDLESNRFRISLITLAPDNSTVEFAGAATKVYGWQDWETINATVTTPDWDVTPAAIYVVINSDHPSGSDRRFYIDNLDVYETNARFIYQKSLGPNANNLYTGAPTHSEGRYTINCQNQKLVIERSRIVGTLAIVNPGAGSCIDYGPIHLSSPSRNEPALVVDGDFAIRGSSGSPLSEAENGVDYNGNGAMTETYDSEVSGLVAVSGDLSHHTRSGQEALIRGQVFVGGEISTSFDDPLAVKYDPSSLLCPAEGTGYHTYERRLGSLNKTIASP